MILHVLVAAGVAGLTWVVGWWGVTIVALIVGVVYARDGGRAWQVALGASEGWAVLLLIDALEGRLGRVATTVAGSMSIPAPALLVVTLLLPALIGWSAATVGAMGRRQMDGMRFR